MSEDISLTAPLRLADAVRLAFPYGGMTVSGLRREIARGRLEVEVIAGKQFTTLGAIEEMRRRCRNGGPAECRDERPKKGAAVGRDGPSTIEKATDEARAACQHLLRSVTVRCI
jgi:hypothetical protein